MKKLLLFTFLITTFLSQAQVSLVKDINPGSADGVATYYFNRIEFNGSLIFGAGNAITSYELWISDGTNTGTYQLNELLTTSATGGSNPNNFLVFNNRVYFSARKNCPTNVCSGGTFGYELFSSDGTTSGIISYPVINYGGGASPTFLTEFNNNLIFSGKASGVVSNASVFYGQELLGFNGNPWSGWGDQIMIKDIHTANGGNSSPDNFTELNSLLYFAATYSSGGRELWVTDGTNIGTNLILDINPGTTASSPDNLTLFNNKIYFTADDGSNGRELWVTDGTVGGTQMVLDLNVGSTGSNPENLTLFNNALYFKASHPTLGTEVFKMTTLENISLLKNIASGSGNSNPSNLFVSNGKLYFSADDGTNGMELWSSTGFSSTTNMLKNINTDAATPDSNPSGFTEYFGELYFAANDGVNGRELWKTDGTNAGTVLVDDINTSGDSNPSDLIVANNRLFFSANDGLTGIELWKYQDTTLSTKDLELENGISLYPNPTSNSFSIESKFQIEKISIYNLQGKMIKLFEAPLELYSIEALTSGIYFVNIQSENGKITKKIIKD